MSYYVVKSCRKKSWETVSINGYLRLALDRALVWLVAACSRSFETFGGATREPGEIR